MSATGNQLDLVEHEHPGNAAMQGAYAARGLADGGVPDGPGRPRPEVRGKFLWVGDEKLAVRGVTYGTFAPDTDGSGYPDTQIVEADFAAMAAHGFTCVRTYTPPPLRVLDAAYRHNLHVLVGLAWEQHVCFLDERGLAGDIETRLREGVRACAGHPAILAYAVGNEIPTPIVRWHGRRRVERFLERLCRATVDEDPGGLVTYVNYPSTEYLQLPFVDFVCFNVFLESRDRLRAYLARLQNIAGDRPLVLTEVGLDSRRNGEHGQAAALEWQVRTALDAGCAGSFVFSWTDEWHRGGHAIEDWDFGLTDRARRPKPALAAVSRTFRAGTEAPGRAWPRVSVVICSHNGARTIGEALQGALALDYPDFEVVVVDDGSTDETGDIAERAGVTVFHTENRGLAAARNTGLDAATGEIVAYLDDDAWPDPHWLRHLAFAFGSTQHAAVGGPNIPPLDETEVAECVARAPGGPMHVLVSDEEAEHIPGCNMAFRATDLRAIGGFDPVFRAAGDDVDVCWRLQESGLTIGFSPAAMVWHRRRSSVRAYLRQQSGYGRAEALLERKWPQKYNGFGHVTWLGHLYGGSGRHPLGRRSRIYFGSRGQGLFQRIYLPPPTSLHTLPLMPEWPLVLALLAGIAGLSVEWKPLLVAAILAAALAAFVLLEAVVSTARSRLPGRDRPLHRRLRQRLLLAALFLLQPVARLGGRLGSGLTPWRVRGQKAWALPLPCSRAVWSERWLSPDDRLDEVEKGVRAETCPVGTGSAFDRWDLEARGGMLGTARLRMAVEEHGADRQLVRFRIRPRVTRGAVLVLLPMVALACAAALDGAWPSCALLATLGGVVLARALADASMSTAALLRGVGRQQQLAAVEDDLLRSLDERIAQHAGKSA